MIPPGLVYKFRPNSDVSQEYELTLGGDFRPNATNVANQHCVGTNMNVSYISFSYPDAIRVLGHFWKGDAELLSDEEFAMFQDAFPKLRNRVNTQRHYTIVSPIQDSPDFQRLLGDRKRITYRPG